MRTAVTVLSVFSLSCFPGQELGQGGNEEESRAFPSAFLNCILQQMFKSWHVRAGWGLREFS